MKGPTHASVPSLWTYIGGDDCRIAGLEILLLWWHYSYHVALWFKAAISNSLAIGTLGCPGLARRGAIYGRCTHRGWSATMKKIQNVVKGAEK